jgi:hypothetical protein
MEGLVITPAVAADAAAVTEIVRALESSLYPDSAFSQAVLEEEWLELDLRRDARVIRDGDRIVGYSVVRDRGDPRRVEGYVHPDEAGRGIGTLIATGLEEGKPTPPPAGCSSRAATPRCASSASCAFSSKRRRPRPSGRTG